MTLCFSETVSAHKAAHYPNAVYLAVRAPGGALPRASSASSLPGRWERQQKDSVSIGMARPFPVLKKEIVPTERVENPSLFHCALWFSLSRKRELIFAVLHIGW